MINAFGSPRQSVYSMPVREGVQFPSPYPRPDIFVFLLLCFFVFVFPQGSSRSAPATLRYLQEYQRLVGADHAWPASLIPEVLRLRGVQSADGGLAKRLGVEMMDLLGHTLSGAETNPNDVRDSASSSPRGAIPPWLLLAVMSAAQSHGQERASDPRKTAEGNSEAPDLSATTVAEKEMRNELEATVAESLSSLDRVRTLLRDPSGLAWQGSGGVITRAATDNGAADELAKLAAAVDPATCLFEGTLRDWLACRGGTREAGDKHTGGSLISHVEGEGGSSRRDSGKPLNKEGLSSLTNEVLALAFRCETAVDTDAQVRRCVFTVGRGRIVPGASPLGPPMYVLEKEPSVRLSSLLVVLQLCDKRLLFG